MSELRSDVSRTNGWKPRVKRYCPQCRYHWAWKLKDGRFKCRRCGQRYTFRSAWDASRLPDRVKQDLLDRFIQGRVSSMVGLTRYARDRFIRLIRMTIAFHEHYHEPFVGSMATHSLESQEPESNLMVLGLRQQQNHIRVFPVFGPDAQRLVDLLDQTSGTEGLYYTADRYAYGTVPVKDGRIVARESLTSDAGQVNAIERFWNEIEHWLYHYKTIPIELFHLFISEVSCRSRYSGQDLSALLLGWIQQTPTHELRNLAGFDTGTDAADVQTRR